MISIWKSLVEARTIQCRMGLLLALTSRVCIYRRDLERLNQLRNGTGFPGCDIGRFLDAGNGFIPAFNPLIAPPDNDSKIFETDGKTNPQI